MTYHDDAIAPLAGATWIELKHERHYTSSGCSLLLLKFVIFQERNLKKKKKIQVMKHEILFYRNA